MGDVISSHLDESRRHYITDCTGKLLTEFGKIYEEQYGVALFSSVRYEIEGNGGPQTQLLHRKVPLKDRVIFSGNLFQYLDDTKKWRNRFCLVPHHYNPMLYDNNLAYERGLQPRVGINCAGYKVLTSLEHYVELLNASVPGGKVKAGSGQMKCATQFPVILWHPYCQHYQFCVMNEREQDKWSAVFQDCVRHCNDGIPEDPRVESAAFTDSVRLYRQARDHYGTWDMLCGNQVQVLSNLVMDDLIPDLKNAICPKLRGKPQEKQRSWLMISDTVYRMVHEQARQFYEGLEMRCTEKRAEMESQIRTDMDQIISCKEHVSNKIRASMLPKAELCVRNHVQSHIPSILEALMLPTSQGFSEVRDLLFKEITEMNMNLVNEGGRDKLGEHMEKVSQLAYHPVKMQPCYAKMDQLNLEGLQQRFDVGSPSVFKQRAQILMREQTDNAVFTFEQMVHQELNKPEGEKNVCRDIQRILERVLKKYDYDSSSVRKKFFQQALLQIIIPFLLKKLAPTCKSELPRFQELIFEELSRFVLVENIYEEVVLQSVMRDIVQAVKEAAVQRKHNLYRDSMVMNNSDPNLHLLGDEPSIDWSEQYANPSEPSSEGRYGRSRQVVSIIQEDEGVESIESCQEAPANRVIPEEPEINDVAKIRGMLVKEFDVEVPAKDVHVEQISKAPVEEEVIQTQEELRPVHDHRSQGEEEATHEETFSQAQQMTHEHEADYTKTRTADEVGFQSNAQDPHGTAEEPEKPVRGYQEVSEVLNSNNQSHDTRQGEAEVVAHDDQEVANYVHAVAMDAVAHYVQEVARGDQELTLDYISHRHPEETPEYCSSQQETEKQSLPAQVVRSTPDDSGFQSPMSEEEEESEGYREIPVPAPRKRDEIITPF
ncbi:protein Niban 2-like isoform X2 [Spea bombifrons]|uniref:protein Niban 2-like isoform X2 n=1 Tax=Spea bombifrons TaxID=233779 RepID=UPI00234BBA8A|nr:protein Niban 2-like isoform X2 [Spea bombifrons]